MWSLTLAAAQDMDMGTAAPAFKEAGDEDFVSFEDYTADRTYAAPVSAKAVNAAADVHETVFAAVQGRESQGADQLPVLQLGGTYRTGLRITGRTFSPGFEVVASAGPDSPSPSSPCGNPHVEKESIAEPEQDNAYNYKNQNFKDIFHSFVCLGERSVKVLY